MPIDHEAAKRDSLWVQSNKGGKHHIVSRLEDELADAYLDLAAQLEAAKRDAERLDYLDRRNDRKNKQNGTTYGWGLTENHNRIALEDHHLPALSARAAIDAAIKAQSK